MKPTAYTASNKRAFLRAAVTQVTNGRWAVTFRYVSDLENTIGSFPIIDIPVDDYEHGSSVADAFNKTRLPKPQTKL